MPVSRRQRSLVAGRQARVLIAAIYGAVAGLTVYFLLHVVSRLTPDDDTDAPAASHSWRGDDGD